MQSRLCIIVVLALLSQGCGRKGPLTIGPPQIIPAVTAASAVTAAPTNP